MRKNKPLSSAQGKSLRVGFDLDGVLLYNPARIARPFATTVKRILFKKRQGIFYIPSSPFEKFIWGVLHKSSLFIAPGFKELKELIKAKKVSAYIITARYNFLLDDFEKWIRKMEADKLFHSWHFNKKNEQPHLFKENAVKRLGLDIYVEDNWDIVKHLNKSKIKGQRSNVKIFWIYNIFDSQINYKYKFPTLKKVVSAISQLTR